MLGKVIGVEENSIYVKLNQDVLESKDLIHHY